MKHFEQNSARLNFTLTAKGPKLEMQQLAKILLQYPSKRPFGLGLAIVSGDAKNNFKAYLGLV